MVDVQTEIVNESLRRAVNRVIDEGIDVEAYTVNPILRHFDPEELGRMAALGIAMTRIIESTQWN